MCLCVDIDVRVQYHVYRLAAINCHTFYHNISDLSIMHECAILAQAAYEVKMFLPPALMHGVSMV